MKKPTLYHILAFLMFAVISCTPNIKNNYLIAAPEGDTLSYTYEAASDWSVVSTEKWFSVSPSSGKAGQVSLSISVSANVTSQPRKASFYIVDGPNNIVVEIGQDCVSAVMIEKDEYTVPMEGGEFRLKIGCNTAFTVSSDASWVSCPSTKASSDYKEMDLVFGIEANPTEEPRSANITFAGDGFSKTIVFNQQRVFFKSVLVMRFTGTWCGYCTAAAKDLSDMERRSPGRANVLCFYNTNNGQGAIGTPEEGRISSYFGVAGYPTLVVDNRAYLSGMSVGKYLSGVEGLLGEMLESYPPATGISAKVNAASDKLEIDLEVFSKIAEDCTMYVYIIEDGVVAAQADYLNLYSQSQLANFVHNGVVRAYVTPLRGGVPVGEPFKAEKFGRKKFHYSVDMPSNVLDAENVSVAAYVTRKPVDGPRSVKGVSYYTDNEYYIDNSVICPANASVDYKYE